MPDDHTGSEGSAFGLVAWHCFALKVGLSILEDREWWNGSGPVARGKVDS